jgi:2-dehydro-3-deoxyphosphogluconate aldolase / (4S)-4-hydroxy-2-oxoglutarate aldolase
MSMSEETRPDGAADAALLTRLQAHRLVPVVMVEDPAAAAPLAEALVEGGLPLAEVTFRTRAAASVLARMAAHPGLCVGAGTVLDAGQVDAAVDAGAEFVVSPGLSAPVLARCAQRGIPAIPGVATATEVMQAQQLGADVVKLFPAAQLGGPAAVASLSAPFPTMRFVPTGGINADTAPDYLRHRSVVAVGGSWMVPSALLAAGDFDQIRIRTADAVAAVSDA